ncbi:MAG: phosphatase family protein [Sediminibacterium sp.]|nr:phosphatase family protein [Sediminibacterium sp.]
MDKTGTYAYRNFITGMLLTAVTGCILMIASLVMGKDALFLFLNDDLGTPVDYFFRFCTNLGDGVMWAVVMIYFIMHRRKSLPMIIAAIVISTVLTQVGKVYVFPTYMRPTAAILDLQSVHTVFGVELLKSYSFPSGHTAEAATIFLLGCLVIRNRWIIPLGFLYVLLVGYSRIYLGQHYPLDVGGGMIVGAITVFLSYQVQKWWDRRRKAPLAEKPPAIDDGP